MKKILNFLFSMKLGIFLLIIIAIYSIVGTVLPQKLMAEQYLEIYGATWGNVINALNLGDVYSSLAYLILLALLFINLVGCTLQILPGQLRRLKTDYTPSFANSENLFQPGMTMAGVSSALRKHGFKLSTKDNAVIGAKNRIGYLGSSITHLGLIIILVGGFFSNFFIEEGYFNLMPGDVQHFPEYGFNVRLEDFSIDFREDKSIDQYRSVLRITDDAGERDETIWVNKPLRQGKVDIYQTSYGWTSHAKILDGTGTVVAEQHLRNWESFFYQPLHLTVQLYGYYPDFVLTSEGEPLSMSEKEDNPHYAVVLYSFGQHIGSYVLEPNQGIPIEGHTVLFSESTLYTGLKYRLDNSYVFIVAGSLVMILGLLMSFYFSPQFVSIRDEEILVYAKHNSWGVNFAVRNALKKLQSDKK